MPRSYFIVALSIVIVLITGFSRVANPPQAEISNGIITAKLYLPDHENGYYRATRFDWSGVISSLAYKGHQYFGQWYDNYDPLINDAIMGPVEDFSPLGYEEAKVGGVFVKIGVGALEKIKEEKYRFSHTYNLVNGGEWKVNTDNNSVEFNHQLLDANGYAYEYSKVVELVMGKPTLEIRHKLKNIGKKRIETSVYNHNFFVIDQELTGPNIETTFPYDIYLDKSGNKRVVNFDALGIISDRSISFSRYFKKGENVYTDALMGFRDLPEDYQFSVMNTKTDAGVKVTGDKALEKIVYWANARTYCAEPYIRLELDPGETINWKNEYDFFTFEKE
ncbi:hypothetical protein [Cyclobacterium marinum]|uniref:Uncharacterized protein n=1 Tax=Cyclobacterium marinum (strain ATCC 25205 / DSM 745 / LMG 13164 / NCIMB 1802) TaxID=880070 RepID=G0IYZ6_CYCMS|nr:hypothetical protein [Cyclobacterium marinum]AEL28141.1 hypothetical protein Cycma_4439 [Cyclobacterium marinum DSM 745]